MEPHTLDLDRLRSWIGRSVEQTEVISGPWCNRLALTLDHAPNFDDGVALPPLWHFITHPPLHATAELDVDGHARRGDFLPPVSLPRRMWAGSSFTFHGDLHVGDQVTKVSTIKEVELKQGRSGDLCFVAVDHTLTVEGETRLSEVQNLVFREAQNPSAAQARPSNPTEGGSRSDAKAAAFGRSVTPSEILLFRYSALTFNSHRIHYDREYATDVEGYPGLVVHGPLTATLLAGIAADEAGGRLASFSFRGTGPLLDDSSFDIAGCRVGDDQIDLWATDSFGSVAMTATATIAG